MLSRDCKHKGTLPYRGKISMDGIWTVYLLCNITYIWPFKESLIVGTIDSTEERNKVAAISQGVCSYDLDNKEEENNSETLHFLVYFCEIVSLFAERKK